MLNEYCIEKLLGLKDIPMFGYNTILKVHKRRHVCKACGKKFYESLPFLPKYQRTTNRLWMYILKELEETRSMKSIAFSVNLSGPSIARVIDKVSYGLSSLPNTISIDEFKGNAGRKFQCILTNPRKQEVLDILPERTIEGLSAYFSTFKDRNNVKYVVMDMSNLFRSMAKNCFPKAQIIADKYHIYRQVQWAFEDVRKQEQKKFATSRRRYFKRSRALLLKGQENLSEEEFEQVSQMLSASRALAQAYYLLHEFRNIMKSKTKEEAKSKLSAWYMHVGVTELNRFKKCVNTFVDWNEEILNAFETGLTNGYTEGCNNRIKVLKRNAYGVRNFDRFRKRILHVMNS
ncbi:MAG: ISL3 family transposase [Firmicutes bacterium]|nr:ISL3 family transposase [Bacillota bacterium]